MTKICKKCYTDKALDCFQRDPNVLGGFKGTCKECIKQYNAEYRKLNKEHIRDKKKTYYTTKPHIQKSIYLRLKYNLTIEQYESMLIAQDYKCAACSSTSVEHNRYKSLCVDHDHATGKVRGLLCHPCNTAIGAAKENVDRLETCAAYLRKHKSGGI